MPDAVYVPVLKGRQGEFAALSKIKPATRASILPMLEIAPGVSDDVGSVQESIDRAIRKLGCWTGNELILDTGLLQAQMEVTNGLGATGYAVAEARAVGIGAVPVVRLADGEQARNDVRAVQDNFASGAALRLNSEDMDEDPEDVDDAVANLIATIGIDRQDIDLVLDLGVVQGDLAVRAGARMVIDVLSELSAVEKWRRVIVTSGSFPADLSAILPWSLGEPQRFDAALWDRIVARRRLARSPIYGDYAIAYPLFMTGPPFPPTPQLRYTVSDRWLVLKGRRNDPRGNDQFYDVCDAIAGHAEFAGVALSSADERIAESRSHGPGNGSTWREIGTIHHLDFVVRRITNLGEP